MTGTAKTKSKIVTDSEAKAAQKVRDEERAALMKQAGDQVKVLMQAAAVRLAMEKTEASAKAELVRLMSLAKMTGLEGSVEVKGEKVYWETKLEPRQSTGVDIDKLTTLITPEQFKQCAKVSLTDAKQILPQALIDQCSVVVTSEPSFKFKAGKGCPVPEVTFYD